MVGSNLSGGCQCGAVRFAAESLGRPSICHCRMCQGAFGNACGALVGAKGLVWTRGAPKHFQSSNKARRGFCVECGTPLTYEVDGAVEVAIGAFDRPAGIAPVIQLSVEDRLPWFDALADLPRRSETERAKVAAFYASVVSYQHPDHDTPAWPPASQAGDRNG